MRYKKITGLFQIGNKFWLTKDIPSFVITTLSVNTSFLRGIIIELVIANLACKEEKKTMVCEKLETQY